jgi:iron complex transport system substrate-binding protein
MTKTGALQRGAVTLARRSAAFFLAWVSFLVLSGAARAVQLTDDRGVTVTLSQSPQRIVSMLPSLTEMVCALDQCQRLVGVDRNSNFPSSVRALPQVGGGLDPSIEAVVALKPDVVLLATSSRASERLMALGIKVVALEPKTHADVRRVLEQIGTLLGVDDAQRVWRVIDAGVFAAAQSLAPAMRSTRVYFEVSSGPYAAGEASFIGETLTRLGVKNIVPVSMGPFPKLNPEFVVRANPDLIMVGDYNYIGMEQRPGWSSMRALREKRLCRFTPEQADMLVRAGPRMAEGARIMARCVADKMAVGNAS